MSYFGIESFTKAWSMLLDIRLPTFMANRERDDSQEEEDVSILPSFPLVGCVVGVCAWLFAGVLAIFPGNPAGAIISALVITIGVEIVTSGRSFSTLLSFIELLFANGGDARGALCDLDDDFTSPRNSYGTLAMVSVFALRLVCFWMLLYYDVAFWIVIVLTSGYAMQAHLASLNQIGTEAPMVLEETDRTKVIWLTTATIMFIAGLKCLPAVAIAFFVTLALAWQARSFCEEKLGGASGAILALAGYITEIIILLSGIILLIRV